MKGKTRATLSLLSLMACQSDGAPPETALRMAVSSPLTLPGARLDMVDDGVFIGACDQASDLEVECTFAVLPQVEAGELQMMVGDRARECGLDGRWTTPCVWPIHLENAQAFDAYYDPVTWAWSEVIDPQEVGVYWHDGPRPVQSGWMVFREQDSGITFSAALNENGLRPHAQSCLMWQGGVQEKCAIPRGPVYDIWIYLEEGDAPLHLDPWESDVEPALFVLPCHRDGLQCVPGYCEEGEEGDRESCNGLDDDCDGQVDEDFDMDGDGFSVCGGDCDDDSRFVYPGAPEQADGLDNDCDGEVDEAFDTQGASTDPPQATPTGMDASPTASALTPTMEKTPTEDQTYLGTHTPVIPSPTPVEESPTPFGTPAPTQTDQLPEQSPSGDSTPTKAEDSGSPVAATATPALPTKTPVLPTGTDALASPTPALPTGTMALPTPTFGGQPTDHETGMPQTPMPTGALPTVTPVLPTGTPALPSATFEGTEDGTPTPKP